MHSKMPSMSGLHWKLKKTTKSLGVIVVEHRVSEAIPKPIQVGRSRNWKSDITLRIQVTWSLIDFLWRPFDFFPLNMAGVWNKLYPDFKDHVTAFLVPTLAFPFQSRVGTCNSQYFLSISEFSNLSCLHKAQHFLWALLIGFTDPKERRFVAMVWRNGRKKKDLRKIIA